MRPAAVRPKRDVDDITFSRIILCRAVIEQLPETGTCDAIKTFLPICDGVAIDRMTKYGCMRDTRHSMEYGGPDQREGGPP